MKAAIKNFYNKELKKMIKLFYSYRQEGMMKILTFLIMDFHQKNFKFLLSKINVIFL